MHKHNKRKVIWVVGAAAIMAAVGPARIYAKTDTWEVLASGLSLNISVKKAAMNTVLYVLKQTHEPVFRKSDGRNYTSKVLLTWDRSLDYSAYRFCPRETLKFNSEKVFTADLFQQHIRNVTENYDPNYKISLSSGCVQVNFGKRREKYLDYLSLYETAPTFKRNDGFEDGLGPYRIDAATDTKIVLSRKEPVARGYNHIVFYEYRGAKDPRLIDRNISDFNRVPPFDIPNWVKDSYVHFDNVELKSVVLMINHPDYQVRSAVYNCFDVEKFRKAYMPKKNDFYNIKTVFPLGVPGAASGKPAQSCQVDKRIFRNTPPLVFANWRLDNFKELAAFFNDFQSKTGVRIHLMNYSPEKLGKVVYSRPKPYNLIVIIFDAIRPEESSFLEAYFRKDTYYDSSFDRMKPVYSKMLYEDNAERREKLASTILEYLKDKKIALPLYQNIGTVYYPSYIKNLTVGRGFLEYPEVGDFRW